MDQEWQFVNQKSNFEEINMKQIKMTHHMVRLSSVKNFTSSKEKNRLLKQVHSNQHENVKQCTLAFRQHRARQKFADVDIATLVAAASSHIPKNRRTARQERRPTSEAALT